MHFDRSRRAVGRMRRTLPRNATGVVPRAAVPTLDHTSSACHTLKRQLRRCRSRLCRPCGAESRSRHRHRFLRVEHRDSEIPVVLSVDALRIAPSYLDFRRSRVPESTVTGQFPDIAWQFPRISGMLRLGGDVLRYSLTSRRAPDSPSPAPLRLWPAKRVSEGSVGRHLSRACRRFESLLARQCLMSGFDLELPTPSASTPDACHRFQFYIASPAPDHACQFPLGTDTRRVGRTRPTAGVTFGPPLTTRLRPAHTHLLRDRLRHHIGVGPALSAVFRRCFAGCLCQVNWIRCRRRERSACVINQVTPTMEGPVTRIS